MIILCDKKSDRTEIMKLFEFRFASNDAKYNEVQGDTKKNGNF